MFGHHPLVFVTMTRDRRIEKKREEGKDIGRKEGRKKERRKTQIYFELYAWTCLPKGINVKDVRGPQAGSRLRAFSKWTCCKYFSQHIGRY